MATRRSPRRENLAKNRFSGKGSGKAESESIKTEEADDQDTVAVKVEEVIKEEEDTEEPQPGPSAGSRKRDKARREEIKMEEGKQPGRKEEVDDSSYASAMLLDVLAQVASDRLETEPQRDNASGKKLSKRVLSTLDILSLEHILQLNDKLLITLFSELTANEMTRNYSFTCLLIPDKCKANYSSYGNELRGKNLMLAHLKQHIKKLVKESEENEEFMFAAEPLHARKRRLAAEKSLMKKVWSKSMKKTVLIKKSPGENFTSLQPTPISSMPRSMGGKKSKPAAATVTAMDTDDMTFTPPPSKKQKATVSSSPKKKGVVGKGKGKAGESVEVEDSTNSDIDVEGGNTPMKVTGDDGPNTSKQVEKTIEENEQFIIDLLRRTQPYQDHNYTTVFGNRHFYPPPDAQDMEALEEELDRPSARTAGLMSLNFQGGREGNNYTNNNNSSSCSSSSQPSSSSSSSNPAEDMSQPDIPNRHVIMKIGGAGAGGSSIASSRIGQQHVPIIRMAQPGAPADNMPIVSAEEVVVQEAPSLEAVPIPPPTRDRRYRPNTKKSQYPPMPKSDLAHQGRVQVLEEMLSEDDEDKNSASQQEQSSRQTVLVVGKRKKLPQLLRADGTTDWERRMALKCIRELRLRKREDGSLNCKICENKSFTATATLMYHYRSHAGIKPFVCLICNTTFTRQHSLNYHMLIHNNQSRFTCKDCGRKFRHPSHFKEHMRRHTGETPFHCTDCPLRFKTRNTYKRHLRTRHNKLLTAEGIQFMPYDPSSVRLKVKEEEEYEDGSEEEEEEGEEEELCSEDEEEELEADCDVDEQENKAAVRAITSAIDMGGTTIPAEATVVQVASSASSSSSSADVAPMGAMLGAIPPENTASNKLLQFCSQVVSQEAG